MGIEYIEDYPEFKKDFKKLLKKYKTLKDDLEVLKRASIELFHVHKINNHSIFEIPKTYKEPYTFFKVKKIACKALKGYGVLSGLRLIYAFNNETNEITFIEFYHKNSQDSENRDRIKRFVRYLVEHSSVVL